MEPFKSADIGDLLIVDDSSLMRDLIWSMCVPLGFERIEVATSGLDALGKLGEHDYWLVISDLRMSPMTGMELLCTIREEEKLKHLKFIMMTTNSEFRTAMDAKIGGADGYLLKPFSPASLRQSIERLIAN